MRRTWIALVLLCAGCGRLWFDPIGDGTGGDDGGTGDGAVIVGDAAMPGVNVNVAFVTASDVVPGALGGLPGADARCQADADAAGLPGTYVAWLSTLSLNAVDRVAGSRGWVRPDGVPLFDSPSDVASMGARAPISLRADGTDTIFEAAHDVFTGSAGGTVVVDQTCGDWTSTTGTTFTGSSHGTSYWEQVYFQPGRDCSVAQRMYCFGVGHDVALATTLPVNSRRAFLSTLIMPGGGVAAFDALCQSDAANAGLGGAWRAFVSTTTASAGSRFDPTGSGWVRLDGIQLATSASELLTVGFRAPLNLRADGVYIDALVANVWTGASEPDVAGTMTCTDWDSAIASMDAATGSYQYGGPTALDWTPQACNLNRPVYCLEQ